MEIKKGYDFLNSIRKCDDRIRRLKYTLAELRACELPRTGNSSGITSQGKSKSQVERIALRIDSLEKDLENVIEQKKIAICDVDDALDKLPEGPEKTILYDCYVARIPMKKISLNVGYSLKHCYKLRKKGIEQMEVEDETINHYTGI